MWALLAVSLASTGLSVALLIASRQSAAEAGRTDDFGDRLEAEGMSWALGTSLTYGGALWIVTLAMLIWNAAVG